MSFLKAIKSALVEDEAGSAPAPAANVAAQQRVVSGQGAQVGATPTATYGTALNPDMVAAVRKATFSRNTALTQLIATAETLADVIPDPVMRLKAAYKTASGGRTANEIADAVRIHLADVDGEEVRFTQAMNAKVTSEVGTLRAQADAAEAVAKNSVDEIQRLTARIGELQQQGAQATTDAATLRGNAQARENELRVSETEFKAAAQAVRDELNGHSNTIRTTLKD